MKFLNMKGAAALLLYLSAAVVQTGCPPPGQVRQFGHVTVLMAGDAQKALVAQALGDKQGGLDIDDMESFNVDVTGIEMEHETGEVEVVFSGLVDINLLKLTELSQLLSNATVLAGTYTKVRLDIENPRMVLLDDPDTVITDIHTTANGRLFISQEFEVPANENSLILIDFNGIHVVERGNGGFNLTPQLRVDLNIVEPVVIAEGVIIVSTPSNQTMVLDIGSSTQSIDFEGATILLPTDDANTPTGTPEDIVVGATVVVHGAIDGIGGLVVDSVVIVDVEVE